MDLWEKQGINCFFFSSYLLFKLCHTICITWEYKDIISNTYLIKIIFTIRLKGILIIFYILERMFLIFVWNIANQLI